MPLFMASPMNFCATSLSWLKLLVVPRTNCTGKPWAPGREGSWNAAVLVPATLFSACCTMGFSWLLVRVRSSQGFSTMPASDWPGTSSWKTLPVSGKVW